MKSRHKVMISNRNLYKEVELVSDVQQVKVGTGVDCDVRLRRELFFDKIEIIFQQGNDGWNMYCSDNLYFTTGDVRKFYSHKLSHGDELKVRYSESNNDVFTLDFVIDFEQEKKDYNIEIELPDNGEIKIGGTDNCDIQYKDEYLENDSITLSMKNGVVTVTDNRTRYGVYVNGNSIANSKKLNDLDFFSVVGLSFYYKHGKLYTSTSDKLRVRALRYRKVTSHKSNFEYPYFSRNSRIKYKIPKEKIVVQQATQMPAKPKNNIVTSLIPALVMLAMTIVLRGIIGGGGTFVIYSAVSMSVGVVMTVVSFIQSNKEYKQNYEDRIVSYNKYIDEKTEKIEAVRTQELQIRNITFESLECSVEEAEKFGNRLFEREQDDEDFLKVYLGRGRVESSNQIEYTKQEFLDPDDPLAGISENVAQTYRYIDDAPIVSDFKTSCGVGVVGNAKTLCEIMKNMTLDISIRHFFKDVKLVYILNDYFIGRMKWVRWLHNVDSLKDSVKNIACDDESKNNVTEELYSILSKRENLFKENADQKYDDHYVVFVSDGAEIVSHPISKYFKGASKYGFTFVFFEECEERIPQGCSEIIKITGENQGYVVGTSNGGCQTAFVFPYISEQKAESIAIKLGGVSVDEVSLEEELTKNITLFELLGILSVEDIDLKKAWESSHVTKSLGAPLGVKRKNKKVYLDISDKSSAHGPHGLVAGTTGSGKSELLQTYILSMAVLFHPHDVGFLLIDFKGGGMANQFKDLPHLVGAITNIDGREINRSLLSIKAEIVKRQEIFSRYGVNHINDYIKLYKSGQAEIALPHLIIIVDEFAELKSEYPDFMKELISTARIGRTLGIHLILATQKPSGVVDAQIWSNSKFKLCLKVQTKEDSNEVIKTPLAAEIVEPGRAYMQVGNNEIFEIFQSAYSGADITQGHDVNEKIYSIFERNVWGKRTLKYSNKKNVVSENSITQLQGVVDHVSYYCKANSIDKLPGICLPPLADCYSTNELNYEVSGFDSIKVPMGIYDDPSVQKQGQVEVDISRDNVYIVGSSQTGKTVMLKTLLYGIVRKYTPSQAQAYLIDCGSMVMKVFEDSKHVGGVVLPNEEEKCKNLFKMLNRMVSQRKKTLADAGIGSYASYLDAGNTDMPLVVIMIDNFAAFKEFFPESADEIAVLSREAQGVGLSIIVTAGSSNAMNYRVQANFGKKYVLNCNDAGEYSSVLGHCKTAPKATQGRGLMLYEKRIVEYQVAMFGSSQKEAEANKELIEYINLRNSEVDTVASPIPMVPDTLTVDRLMSMHADRFKEKGILPVGMDFNTVAPISVNLNTCQSLALVGDGDGGVKNQFIINLLEVISRTAIYHNIEAVVIDSKQKKLKSYENCGFIKTYTSDAFDGMDMCIDFLEMYSGEEKDESGKDTYPVLILNNNEVFRKMCDDKHAGKLLTDAIRNKSSRAFVVLGTLENQSIGFGASDVMKAIKECQQGVLFAPIAESKLYDTSARFKKESVFDASMAYRIDGNTYSRIKLFN